MVLMWMAQLSFWQFHDLHDVAIGELLDSGANESLGYQATGSFLLLSVKMFLQAAMCCFIIQGIMNDDEIWEILANSLTLDRASRKCCLHPLKE